MTKKKNYAQQRVWQFAGARIDAGHALDFLSKEQKDKILDRNAERFFEKNVAGK